MADRDRPAEQVKHASFVAHARLGAGHSGRHERAGREPVAGHRIGAREAVAAGLAVQPVGAELQMIGVARDILAGDRDDLPARLGKRRGREDRAAAAVQGPAVGFDFEPSRRSAGRSSRRCIRRARCEA